MQGSGTAAVMGVLSAGMSANLLRFGAATGLLAVLARGPATTEDLAVSVGGDPRMTREWLAGLEDAGLVSQVDGAFALVAPIEDLMAPVGLFTALSDSVPVAVGAFHRGGRADSAEYPAQLPAAMEVMTEAWLTQFLLEVWVPQIPGAVQRLSQAGHVIEVGAGSAPVLAAVLRRFPSATGDAFELDDRLVADARARAVQQGLSDRLSVFAADARSMSGECDLVLALNVLHDAHDLSGLLDCAARHLRPGGHVVVVESQAVTPDQAVLLHATSLLFCIPTTRARGVEHPLGTLGLSVDLLNAARPDSLAPAVTLASPLPMAVCHILTRRDS